ncbi:hypothetical protein BDV98DRAFT_576142 [Pterulicium gracile]|uniref:Cofilin n=1 Tax=Pterulicium gracile TaxID=1884261 RepID=A0A5C3Q3U4_9AGAR|nr:hypothetical protein BDV98DRAFT_576142 [Pterula gracilis]
MAAFVSLNDSCLEEFDKLKQGELRYLTFALEEDNTKIGTEKTGGKAADGDTTSKDYDAFKSDLTSAKMPSGSDACRFAVYAFTKGSERKVAFIYWIPKTAKPRTTMLYNSSKPIIKTSLTAASESLVEVKAESVADLELEKMLSKVFSEAK